MIRKFQIRPTNHLTDTWIAPLLIESWGSTEVVSRGVLHDASQLPGFVACDGDTPLGLVTYKIIKYECEIVTLDSLVQGIGVGTALIEAVIDQAKDAVCRRVWLITTNDNLKAMRFYQKRGFFMVAIRSDVIDDYRKLKPSIPRTGLDGIPIRDEIEFEMHL